MKQFRVVTFFLICSSIATAHVVPYFSIRSQSENAARELVQWQTQINLCDQEEYYGAFSITPEYTRSYKPENLARFLFCDAIDTSTCCDNTCSVFRVQGSTVTARTPRSLLADYFGLPTDYDSTITLEPRIQNYLVDFNFYVGLDSWYPGLYFRVHAPFVHTIWDLGFCEEVTNAGVAPHPLGYFNGQVNGETPNFYSVPRENLVGTFEGFVARCETPKIDAITFHPLEEARMSTCDRHASKLSDIQMAFGWNVWTGCDYHFGINLRAAAPTGSRPEGCWLFEPIAGNGKHGELGLGISTHWTPWRNKEETEDFSFYIDANITHLFKARQCRTFDYRGKPLSRYMLAAKMKTPSDNLYNTDSVETREAPTYQFADEFTSVANLSTIPVDVSAAVQGDIVLKFAYTHHNFQLDFGYEFWGRSCEKIHPRKCTAPSETWALKGDAFVYGFAFDTPAPASDDAVALSASEIDATVFCGTNNAQRSVANNLYWTRNPGIDNPQLAYDSTSAIISNNQEYGSATFYQMYSSFDPHIFSTAETTIWDIKAAQLRSISHKVFANFGYIWKDRCPWSPFLGFGVEVEMGKIGKQCCSVEVPHCITKNPTDTVTAQPTHISSCCPTNTNCTECASCALSQWGIWIKGGVSYN